MKNSENRTILRINGEQQIIENIQKTKIKIYDNYYFLFFIDGIAPTILFGICVALVICYGNCCMWIASFFIFANLA